MKTYTDSIDNSQDIIDSRDIIARIEHLTEEREELKGRDLKDWKAEYQAELDALTKLAEEAEGYAPDWIHGATLIHESYFTEYCEELCKDIGHLPKEIPHYIAIDWEQTAQNIMTDYTHVDFDGVTYLVR